MTTSDEQRHRLTRNTVYLTAASIVQKLISSAYFLVFPNFVGTSVAGAYFFAVSFANLFSILVDAGLSPLIIREVAKEHHTARDTTRRALTLKLMTGAGALGIIALAAWNLVPDPLRRELLVFTALAMVLESISLTCYGVLRGLQRLRFEAIGATLHQVTVLSVGIVGLALTHASWWLGVTLLLAALVNMGYALVQLRRVLRSQPVEPSHWSPKQLGPFFVSGGLTRLYAYIDVVLLGWLASNHIVGLYGAAYKIAYTFQFVPIAFNAGLYPALAQAAAGDRVALREFVDRGIRFLLFVGWPLAIGLALFASDIFKTFLPAFVDATPALQLAVLGLPGLFLSFLFSSLLNATNRQRNVVQLLTVVVAVNVVLNLVFIPRWQHTGASFAAFVSAWVYAGYGWWLCRHDVQLSHTTKRVFKRLAIALIALVAVGLLSQPIGSFVMRLVLAGATFVVVAIGVRAIDGSTVAELRRAFRR